MSVEELVLILHLILLNLKQILRILLGLLIQWQQFIGQRLQQQLECVCVVGLRGLDFVRPENAEVQAVFYKKEKMKNKWLKISQGGKRIKTCFRGANAEKTSKKPYQSNTF